MTAACKRSVYGSLLVFAVAILFTILTAPTAAPAQGAEPPSEPPNHWGPISSTMEEIPYPHPVQYLDINIFGQDLKLAYMDVKPEGRANGQTAMLFHGMNFTEKPLRSRSRP